MRRFRSLSIPTKRALRNYVKACYQSQDVPWLVPEMATIREIAVVCTEWDTLWDRKKGKENTTMYVVWHKSKEITLVVTQITCPDKKLINSYKFKIQQILIETLIESLFVRFILIILIRCFSSERLTVTECLQHPWFGSFDDPQPPLSLSSRPALDQSPIQDKSSQETKSFSKSTTSAEHQTTTGPSMTKNDSEKQKAVNACQGMETKPSANRAISSHTENIYTKSKMSPKPTRFGLSSDRRDTFKRNMDSLAQKFSGTEIMIIEPVPSSGTTVSSNVTSSTQRRATATHTMPAGEVFKCTPVFILGEEQQCSDSGSDSVSEISTDSSSDRSSIYSDDSLDFILYGKSQGRATFPFSTTEAPSDRWEHRHHTRVWSRECNGVVSKALSRFSSETSNTKFSKATTPPTAHGKAGLEALRERGGNLVVIREPVRAGRYTRYSEVQCESVQARIRRFQVHGAS